MTQPHDPRVDAPQCLGLQPVTLLHRNPRFTVYDRGGWFTTEYDRPQVVVLPIVDRRHVVMVRVKRPVICDDPLELPAGAVDEGEDAIAGAQRELAEETGIRLADLSRFRALPPLSHAPNRSPMLLHVVGVGLSRQEFDQRGPHDDEIRQVLLFDAGQVADLLRRGEIYVSTPAAILASHFLMPLLAGHAWEPVNHG